MSAQTEYNSHPAIAFSGLLVDNSLRQIDSGLVETGPFDLGICVKQGSTDAQYLLIDGDADVVAGLVVYSIANEKVQDDPSLFQYTDKSQFPLLVEGRVWVTAGEAVTKGATTVFFDYTEKKYYLSAAAGRAPVPNAKFYSSADADAFVQLELVR